MKNFLYHYCSIESLACILHNRTLKFNNLTKVDDPEEAVTADMGNFGRLCYVSCWTNNPQESIPMWNLYTPNGHGVRIRMKEFPFVMYHYKKGEYLLDKDADSYINLKRIYDENKVIVVPDSLKLLQVNYTDDVSKLFPIVKETSYYDFDGNLVDISTITGERQVKYNTKLDFSRIGRFKRENWAFEHEWRYIISTTPMGFQEAIPWTQASHDEFVRRLSQTDSAPPCDELYLDISQDAIDSMEILLGPNVTEAEEIIIRSLIKEYAPACLIRKSTFNKA